MAFTTLTRYLKLKIDSDLSADAVYNLQRIDALASTFVIDSTEKLKIQSKGNIELEPNDLALGGSGTEGSVEVGTSQHSNVSFRAYTTSFKVDSGLETKNQSANKTNYLKLAFDSQETADKTLNFDVTGGNSYNLMVSAGGTITTLTASQTLTNKTFDADVNTLSNVRNSNVASDAGIVYSKLVLTGSVDNDDIATGAAIAYSKLNLTGNVVDADIASNAAIVDSKLATISAAGKVTNSATTATSSNTNDTIVARDASGNFSAGTITANLTGNVTGNVSGTASNVTGTVAIVNGGTGATTAATAAENLLPAYSSNANKVLGLNAGGTALEWKNAGTGIVDTISVSSPLTIDNSIASLPSISIPQASVSTNGYLSSTDWNTFNNKEPAITGSGNASQFWNGNKTFASLTESDIPTLSQAKVTDLTADLAGKEPSITAGTTGQYWRGDKSWQTLDKSAVGLSNVDNTSDVNKPVSSATQTALNAKYDASNPSNFVDAAGAKSAAVVNSTAGSETDQAPSVSAMKSYVTANSGPKFSTTWTVADGNSKTVTHSLDTREVSITIYDENYETVYVDSETRTTVNAVDLVRVGTATGTWTVIVKKL